MIKYLITKYGKFMQDACSWMMESTGMSYAELNVWLFIIVMPGFILLFLILFIRYYKKYKKLKKEYS